MKDLAIEYVNRINDIKGYDYVSYKIYNFDMRTKQLQLQGLGDQYSVFIKHNYNSKPILVSLCETNVESFLAFLIGLLYGIQPSEIR